VTKIQKIIMENEELEKKIKELERKIEKLNFFFIVILIFTLVRIFSDVIFQITKAIFK
jgi:hypothetical protein